MKNSTLFLLLICIIPLFFFIDTFTLLMDFFIILIIVYGFYMLFGLAFLRDEELNKYNILFYFYRFLKWLDEKPKFVNLFKKNKWVLPDKWDDEKL